MKGFRDFLVRGNLLELAVAFIMGAAFSDVVKAFTGIIMGIISKIFGGDPNFNNVTIAGVNVGQFITALIAFVLIGTVLYWCIVKPLAAVRARFQKQEEPPATELDVLTEIRDLLSKQH